MSNCTTKCWIFAAAMGVLVLLLTSLGGIGPGAGLFLGLVTAGILGALLSILFCQGADDVEDWPKPVDNAKDPDVPGALSIRRDDAPVAQVPIARPVRPEGMDGAPQGASTDPAQAVTFTGSAGGGMETTDASRAVKARRGGRKKAGELADTPETAHSGSVPGGEAT